MPTDVAEDPTPVTTAAPPAKAEAPVLAGYLLLQAAGGIVFWAVLWASPTLRSQFDLVESMPQVADAFFLADMLIGVLGSTLGAWAVWARVRWALPVVAVTTGGILYPTLFLLVWVTSQHTAEATLAIMIPPSVLSSWVTWRVWRLSRSGAGTGG